MVRDLVAIVACNSVVLSKRPIPWRRGREDGVIAQIVRASAAVIAPSAWHTGFNGYAITNFEILDLRSNLDNCSRTLVTENDRAVENKVPDSSTLPVVDIATADAGLCYMDTNFMLVGKSRLPSQ